MKNFMRIFILCLALSMSIAHATSTTSDTESDFEQKVSSLITDDSNDEISNSDSSKTEAASVSDCNCEVSDSVAKPLASRRTGVTQSFAEDLKESIAKEIKEDLETQAVVENSADLKVASVTEDVSKKASAQQRTAALDAASLNALYMAAYQQGYQQAQMAATYTQQYASMSSNPGVTTLTNSLASINSSLNTMPTTTVTNGTYPSFAIYNPNSALYAGQTSTSGILPAPTYTSYGASNSGVLAAPGGSSNTAMGSPYMLGAQMRSPYMNSGVGFNVRLGMGY